MCTAGNCPVGKHDVPTYDTTKHSRLARRDGNKTDTRTRDERVMVLMTVVMVTIVTGAEQCGVG